VQSTSVSDGWWERGAPAGDGTRGDPIDDYDNSGACWLTGNHLNADLDGGPTVLTSPAINVSTGNNNTIASYALWFYNQNAVDEDRLRVEISNDNGQTWRYVHQVASTNGWQVFAFRVTEFATCSSQMKLRFTVSDNPNDSVTEAGVDDMRICFSGTCALVNVNRLPGDVNNDSVVNSTDLVSVIGSWGSCACPADLNRDGIVNVNDMNLVISNWD